MISVAELPFYCGKAHSPIERSKANAGPKDVSMDEPTNHFDERKYPPT